MPAAASLLLFASLLTQADGQTLPRLIDTLPCEGPVGEIVVCGRRPGGERFRIPPELRASPPSSRNHSWAARARDEREASRYEDQVTGPGAAFNRARQRDCEWRAERQQLTGRQIDCSRRVPFELRN